jgi:hypothetical protein
MMALNTPPHVLVTSCGQMHDGMRHCSGILSLRPRSVQMAQGKLVTCPLRSGNEHIPRSLRVPSITQIAILDQLQPDPQHIVRLVVLDAPPLHKILRDAVVLRYAWAGSVCIRSRRCLRRFLLVMHTACTACQLSGKLISRIGSETVAYCHTKWSQRFTWKHVPACPNVVYRRWCECRFKAVQV